ncbi:MAG: RDD family protein [Chloroflexi bacterium]|nr:RDD family protein [Chloroflexota bacterium]
MEERYHVATPENIAFTYDIAGIGSRFMAALVDALIYFLISIALALAFSSLTSSVQDPTLESTLTAVYIGISFVLYWGYYILFELIWGGQSPGKRLVKLRVVRLDGTPATAGQIIIRNIARLVDIFPGFYAVGLIVMFLNSQSRRLGDFAAGTLVVRETQQLSLQHISSNNPPTNSLPNLPTPAMEEAAALPVNRLNQEHRQLVREFVARRGTMSDKQRAKLALQIGQAIAQAMDAVTPADAVQAEHLLELTAVAINQ